MASTAKTLGELMKEHRNRLQLTQEEVAEMIGMKPKQTLIDALEKAR